MSNLSSSEPPDGPRPSQQDFPLAGQSVLVTRAAHQAPSLCVSLEELGADTIVHPVVEISPPDDNSGLDDGLQNLEAFSWLVFVSPNAVRHFVDRLAKLRGSIEAIRRIKIAAIGTSTAAQLENLTGCKSNLIPPQADSGSLGQVLVEKTRGRLLIPRGNRRSPTLTQILTEAGRDFEQPVVYVSADVKAADPVIVQKLNAGQVDWVTLTSSAIARSAVNLFGESLRQSKLVTISPATTQALADAGHHASAEAVNFNLEGLIEAMING